LEFYLFPSFPTPAISLPDHETYHKVTPPAFNTSCLPMCVPVPPKILYPLVPSRPCSAFFREPWPSFLPVPHLPLILLYGSCLLWHHLRILVLFSSPPGSFLFPVQNPNLLFFPPPFLPSTCNTVLRPPSAISPSSFIRFVTGFR